MTQNFQIVKPLGQGSFGAVKLVKRKEDGNTYAMKEINVAKMDQRDRADQLNEIRILASIFHPNVLAYYEAFVENGKLYIITEYAELGDLDGEIQARQRANKPFTEQEVWSVFLQVLSGLRELHNNNILHRDIKGQNVLRFANPSDRQRPIYKLADFGVSKVLHSETDFTKTQIGTPYYLCPEIWQNKKYDDKADIFSLGVLLYELMQLKHPYDGRDMKELNRNVMRGQYKPLPGRYSEELRNLCYNMLQKDPDKRMSVKEIFIQRYVEEHYKDAPISVEELNIGQETALEANVDWDDPAMLATIQMNPKLLAAMAGRLGAQQNPYVRNRFGNYYAQPMRYGQAGVAGSKDDLAEVQKSLPDAEYDKRKEFEKLQQVHEKRRKERESQVRSQSEQVRKDNASPAAPAAPAQVASAQAQRPANVPPQRPSANQNPYQQPQKQPQQSYQSYHPYQAYQNARARSEQQRPVYPAVQQPQQQPSRQNPWAAAAAQNRPPVVAPSQYGQRAGAYPAGYGQAKAPYYQPGQPQSQYGKGYSPPKKTPAQNESRARKLADQRGHALW